MLLLVDDDEAQLLELDAFPEDRVRADDDVDLTGLQVFPGLLRLGRGHQPRQPADPDREAVKPLDEVPVVLAGEQGGRATIATCMPDMAATKAARSATSVLPKPTSPQTSRSIGLPDSRSASTSSIARSWSSVSS